MQHLGERSSASVCSCLLFSFNWVENNVFCLKRKKKSFDYLNEGVFWFCVGAEGRGLLQEEEPIVKWGQGGSSIPSSNEPASSVYSRRLYFRIILQHGCTHRAHPATVVVAKCCTGLLTSALLHLQPWLEQTELGRLVWTAKAATVGWGGNGHLDSWCCASVNKWALSGLCLQSRCVGDLASPCWHS